MKLTTAIKDMEERQVKYKNLGNKVAVQSLGLGIEAMKHIEAYRHPPFQGSKELLPGETE